MNLKYFEKLMIAVVVFIGVVIVTAFIIGTYVNKKRYTLINKSHYIQA